jgi:hypothetical protein
MDLSAYVGLDVMVQFHPGFVLLVPVVTPNGKVGPATMGAADKQVPLTLPFLAGMVVRKKLTPESAERIFLDVENGVQKNERFLVELAPENVFSVCVKGDKRMILVPS